MFKFLQRTTCGCMTLLVLLVITLLGALSFLLAERAHAQDVIPQPGDGKPARYNIMLVSDQSVSMWDCDGVGSDPELLRVDAVQLFAAYLGADSHSERFRLGLVHFGGEPRLMAPLTDVNTEASRRQLGTIAENPEPIPWTDPLEALQMAQAQLAEANATDARNVIVLMTDGEPA